MKKRKNAEKVIYYSDLLNDDFAGNSIKKKDVDENFKFVHKSKLWNIVADIVYYVIAVPLVYLMCKIILGLKFKNRKALKKLRKSGYYLYGNHTQMLDAYLPSMAAFPKRAYILANADAVSLPCLKNIVTMLGVIPIPTKLSGMKKFLDAISTRFQENACIAVFPEAHIWPFYTGIRPFKSTSFKYPVKENAPVVAMVTTYRKRLFFKRPAMTVTISEPMYIDNSLPIHEAQEEIRNRVYDFMVSVSQSEENIEYIRYIDKSE